MTSGRAEVNHLQLVDRSVKAHYLIPIFLTLLVTVALAASNIAQVSFRFRTDSGITFYPLKYAQNLTIYPGDKRSLNNSNVMTLTISKASAILSFASQATNTTLIFQAITLTLSFNSTQLSFNGLLNQTSTLTLNKGVYIISTSLSYTALASMNPNILGSWTITMTGS